MSLWTRITEALSALAAGESLASVFDKLRTPPERSIAFTIAVIGLGAKIAKADGIVTRDEVFAFREVFQIPPEEEAHAAKLYNLARQDVAGFEEYAASVAKMFTGTEGTLCYLMEGLFHIAVADGSYHPNEDVYLQRVSEIFGLDERQFKSLRTRFVPDADPDPWDVLGVDPETPKDKVKAAWRQLVRDSHPDLMMARGVPEEAVKMAEKRLVAINRAWESINAQAA